MSSPLSPACLLLSALLPLQALAQPLGVSACRGLRERRNQLAAEAMQAEIALVLAMRRRLCPRQEALAEQANANAGAGGPGDGPAATPDASGQGDLDYTAYLQCRQQAEARLRRTQVILYTNARGFTFYTRDGARLAREAEDWQQRLRASCPSVDGT